MLSRIMLKLSRGGADATVCREFDIADKAFVQGGFRIEEAKSYVSWKDKDTLIVGSDFGDGKSLTESGYPRQVSELCVCVCIYICVCPSLKAATQDRWVTYVCHHTPPVPSIPT